MAETYTHTHTHTHTHTIRIWRADFKHRDTPSIRKLGVFFILNERNKNKMKEQIKSQSGRSMVEMLGVLAIIGVLSIGGIAGYRYAMNKYHTNEILNTLDTAMLLLGNTLRTNENAQLTVNVNNEMDIFYNGGWVELRKKGTSDLFYFPFNEGICEALASQLDVMKWSYLPHNAFSCGGNIVIMVARGFSSYFDGWGQWGGVNCIYETPSNASNVSSAYRMGDCDHLTDDKMTLFIGA